MVTIEPVDTQNRSQVRRFVELTYRVHAGLPQWIPPLRLDEATYLNRKRHPFFTHSAADFFLAVRDGRDVGRIAALENRRYNEHHHARQAQFYLFECEEDPEAARSLFEAAFQWARQRSLERIIGPKGFSVLDGFGLLVEGFEQPQLMSLLTYNPPYYIGLVEANGFSKEIDFLSASLEGDQFQMPAWLRTLASSVEMKHGLHQRQLHLTEELFEWNKWSDRLIEYYNQVFVDSWEYWPLTPQDVRFVGSNIRPLVRPELMTVIERGNELTGFLFGFPDVSAALRRANGHLGLFSLLDLLIERQRARGLVLYALGLSPELRLDGGVAVLVNLIEQTARKHGIRRVDFTEVSERTWQVLNELRAFDIQIDRIHRVYGRDL
jgi:hypothetical protein